MSPALAADANRGRVALVTGGGTGHRARDRASPSPRPARRRDLRAAPGAARGGPRAELEARAASASRVPADVREPDQVRELVDAALERFGAVDVLVNNAGGQFTAPAEEITAKGCAPSIASRSTPRGS